MSKDNNYIPHSQITLVPGLAKRLLFTKNLKNIEFYGYLRSSEHSGCIKNYSLSMFNFETNLSLKTIKRRLKALEKLGWIDIKGKDLYVRGIKKVCKSVNCNYNEEKPRKKKITTNKNYTIKDALCFEVLKDNIKAQEMRFISHLKDSSKPIMKAFKKLGTNGVKAWLLNNNESMDNKHSDLLVKMDISTSRETCAKFWNCSSMDASRIIKRLSGHNMIQDVERFGMIKKGSESEAMMLRKVSGDKTIFHKKGKIFKKLNNSIKLVKLGDMEYIPDSLFEGEKKYTTKFLIRLEMMYTSHIAQRVLKGLL